MNKNLFNLQKKIKVKFKDIELLKKSLTHKSHNPDNNYERLEFLGDRVLGITISKRLLDLYPDEKVGNLDKKLASLVNKNRCYEIGKKLNLEKYVLIGKTQKKIKIENKIISDCIESLIGAIYIDKGFYFTEKFILRIWKEFIISTNVTLIDSKTKLQEYSLKKFKTLPIYKLLSNTGPKHKPNFKVCVKLKDTSSVEASGTSIKKAEQAAADLLIKNLNL
tara:strand:+ start:1822 stop:2484 length:663 start_codon:yes stop_codon:yes gene_type:complete